MTAAPEQYPIDRLLVVFNSTSSQAGRMERQIGQLTMPHKIIPMSATAEQTHDRIMKHLCDGAALLIASGDGGFNQMINIMLSPAGRDAALHEVPVAPLRGGKANDIATMVQGRASAQRVTQVGHQVAVRPLAITINNQPPKFGLGYFTIGGTARATAALDAIKIDARQRREAGQRYSPSHQRFDEIVAAVGATAGQTPFEVCFSPTAPQQVTDVDIFRGNRMAIYGRPPASLKKPAFNLTLNSPQNLAGTMATTAKFGAGLLRGAGLFEDVDFSIASANGDPIYSQLDGEKQLLESGSHIEAAISEHHLNLLSVRL